MCSVCVEDNISEANLEIEYHREQQILLQHPSCPVPPRLRYIIRHHQVVCSRHQVLCPLRLPWLLHLHLHLLYFSRHLHLLYYSLRLHLLYYNLHLLQWHHPHLHHLRFHSLPQRRSICRRNRQHKQRLV